ncbi:MAG: DUF3152 domain-containing protein [Candidatus Saccharimonadales bacterium]
MSFKKGFVGGITVVIVLALALLPLSHASAILNRDLTDEITGTLTNSTPFGDISSTAPSIPKPDWYTNVTIYYTVASNGSVSDINTFATLANQTLNDAKGWSRLGAKFVKVTTGGTLHLVLAQSSLLPSYSSGCSSDWSCTVGNTVIINDDRWVGASDSWNAAGGSLRDYRNMVINHETGHWLGHGHEFCTGAGNLASVMQQQSIDLQSCKFNPWPLDSELWTSRF